MAAPKKWGYTRDKQIGDEMLVAWSDGDLIEAVVFEVNEHLLRHRASRRMVAAWARASEDTMEPVGRDWLMDPPKSLVTRCKEIARR
ncbi:MAG TPA: hypothetical protein VKA86_08350 [Candidatus Krumholzibacteria bacterium]|nr:hypothetical protein [Candidatus Krumholzibacteria bacterium]